MKFKIILLVLPAIVLLYVFVVRDRIDTGSGIGGGGYDLTKMYTGVAAGIYLLILNLVLLIQNAKANRSFLPIGTVMLIADVIMTVRSF
jgi:hypothetical protein